MKDRIDKFSKFLVSNKGLWFVILGIIVLNSVFYNLTFSEKQSRKDAAGFSYDKAKHFAYFHYYTGYFPLATLNKELVYTDEGAKNEIEKNGSELIMEYQHWSRLGENARIWAFLPNSMIAGTPETPSLKLFNALIFIISLVLLYYGFWRIKQPIYGLVLLLLINLTPYYLYEVYMNRNIFALLGSTFFMIIGLNVSFLFKKESKYRIIISALISGFIIGFFSEFRNEISIVLVSLILIYLLAVETRIFTKILLVLISYFSFTGTKTIIQHHFNNEFEKTAQLVESAGGHVYTGKRIPGHKFWHPVFCGLGDFDQKYGYEWNDKVAYKYATPILQKKYGMDITYSDKYYLDNYYDTDSLYYIKFDEIDEYEAIMKDKVLSDIKNDPLWYLTILFKRIIRTLTVTIPFSYVGWLIFIVVFLFIKRHQWFHLKLLLIALPLSATSIIIYSGDGATYNSVFAYFVIMGALIILKHKLSKIWENN